MEWEDFECVNLIHIAKDFTALSPFFQGSYKAHHLT